MHKRDDSQILPYFLLSPSQTPSGGEPSSVVGSQNPRQVLKSIGRGDTGRRKAGEGESLDGSAGESGKGGFHQLSTRA